jgi:hypothetical protein
LRTIPASPGEKGSADIQLIRLGRRERRAIGDIRPLADSIRDSGLRHPVTISRDYGLISGRRRLAAYEHLGQSRIPYRAVGTISQALAAIAAEDADSRQALPMTIAEAIFRDWQMRDELEWWPRAGNRKGDPGTRMDHRNQLAAAAGLNGSQYTRAYAVILAAEGFRRQMNRLHALDDEMAIAAAREAAKLLETTSGAITDKAYSQYRAQLHVPPAEPPAAIADVDAALARLSGAVAAFSTIELPPDAGPEILQHWDDVMTKQISRPLAQFRRNKIRSTQNAPG